MDFNYVFHCYLFIIFEYPRVIGIIIPNVVFSLTKLQLEDNESQERTIIFIRWQAINPQSKKYFTI